jgi:hypothetical protein
MRSSQRLSDMLVDVEENTAGVYFFIEPTKREVFHQFRETQKQAMRLWASKGATHPLFKDVELFLLHELEIVDAFEHSCIQ